MVINCQLENSILFLNATKAPTIPPANMEPI